MKIRTFGDQLEGSIINDEEWAKFKCFVDKQDKPLTIEGRERILKKLKILEKKFNVGENKLKCLLCGANASPRSTHTLCRACRKALTDRGVVRQCGTVHGAKQRDLLCAVCEEQKAFTHGLCRRCFYLIKTKKFESPEQLSLFYKNDEIATQSLPIAPLTRVR